MSALLLVGSLAPEFEAVASDGVGYALSQLLREAHLLLIFYPGNDTPG